MSKENLEGYEIFFAEIPQYFDYLSEIINQDSAVNEALPPENPPSLSPEQVERLADDSRQLSDPIPTSDTDSGDTLFSKNTA